MIIQRDPRKPNWLVSGKAQVLIGAHDVLLSTGARPAKKFADNPCTSGPPKEHQQVAHWLIKVAISRQIWRREWDSNPRYSYPYSGFQDRRLRPLGHPSAVYFISKLRPCRRHNRFRPLIWPLRFRPPVHFSVAHAGILHHVQRIRSTVISLRHRLRSNLSPNCGSGVVSQSMQSTIVWPPYSPRGVSCCT